MSRELVESIISNNMLEANDILEAKLAEIREKKMYEMKRMYAAESIKDNDEPEIWKGGRRAGPEFDAFLARNKERYEKSKQEYKKAKKAHKKEFPKSSYQKPGLDPRAARNRERADKIAAEHPPGSGVLSVAKAVGSETAKGIGTLTKELGSISRF